LDWFDDGDELTALTQMPDEMDGSGGAMSYYVLLCHNFGLLLSLTSIHFFDF
jgi:hypothetical protein